METTPEPVLSNDEPMIADDINAIAKFLDALMEADFEINRNKGLSEDEG